MSALDTQVGGGHYKDMAIQPLEYILANKLNFIEGNIIKYITRYHLKGGIEDVEKVIHYATILKEQLSSEESSMDEEWTISFKNSEDKVVTRTISITPKQMASMATQKLIQIMADFSEDEYSMDEVLSTYVTIKK